MTRPRSILVFMGTRPEAIKLAPVVAALRDASDLRCTVVATGQHREMFQQVAETFGFKVDADLDVMRPNQTLAGLTARLMESIDGWLGIGQPDMALVQGDTTTVLVAALACFYRRIPIGHVEAGLRTGNIWSPFPEEVNRRLASPLDRAALRADRVGAGGAAARGRPRRDASRSPATRSSTRCSWSSPPQAADATLRAGIDAELGRAPGRRLGSRAVRPHHRAPPRELRRRHRADLRGHRQRSPGASRTTASSTRCTSIPTSRAREPAAGRARQRPSDRAAGLPQLRRPAWRAAGWS